MYLLLIAIDVKTDGMSFHQWTSLCMHRYLRYYITRQTRFI